MKRREFVQYSLILAGVGGICGFSLKKIGDKYNLEKMQAGEALNNCGPCLAPFENIEIHPEGDVYPCCPGYLYNPPEAFGNIIKSDFKDIWNGPKLNEIRNKILNNDYSLCDRKICDYVSSSYTKDFDASKQGPKQIFLCYDQECNYKCITCRDNIITNTDEELKIYDNVILPKILPLLKDAKEIMFSGGDPLSSRHSRRLIKAVCEKNTKAKLSLFTNGYFFDERNMKELGVKKLKSLSISISAATKETYNKIMQMDAFDKIMENLAFALKWKKQGKIEEIDLNFVVHSMNYKEMIDFVKIAEKFDAMAIFWEYRPWPWTEMHKHYKEVAVFEPYHKEYPKLKKMLHNPIFKSTHCSLYPLLQNIADSP